MTKAIFPTPCTSLVWKKNEHYTPSNNAYLVSVPKETELSSKPTVSEACPNLHFQPGLIQAFSGNEFSHSESSMIQVECEYPIGLTAHLITKDSTNSAIQVTRIIEMWLKPATFLLPQSWQPTRQKHRRNPPHFQTCVCRIGSWGWAGEGLLCMVPLPGSSLDAWRMTGLLSPLLLAEGLASDCRACWELASFWATGHRDPPSRARGPLGRPSLRSGPLASGATTVGKKSRNGILKN